ncbi:hypothetical protein CGRA01v4_00555 [Colletotrichum graminicola]|nr:hypothetical protein CGRA01v4_00555 [Colletotrichum graminicola]
MHVIWRSNRRRTLPPKPGTQDPGPAQLSLSRSQNPLPHSQPPHPASKTTPPPLTCFQIAVGELCCPSPLLTKHHRYKLPAYLHTNLDADCPIERFNKHPLPPSASPNRDNGLYNHRPPPRKRPPGLGRPHQGQAH